MSTSVQTFGERVHSVFLQNKDKWLSAAYVATQLAGGRGAKDSIHGTLYVLYEEGYIRRVKAGNVMPSQTKRAMNHDRARYLYKYEKPYQAKQRKAAPVTRTTFTRPRFGIKTSNKLITLARDVLEGDMDNVDITMELLDMASELKALGQ